ncbi:MAG: type II toxin-antitoxin system prevent-host-death family antitoxin [Candidatus Limnocylindrales bacterium]|nr:type II toxin-antitoxin system prevent-host-death family antitoxin [Candidatus Limnocylindrales bacterium]
MRTTTITEAKNRLSALIDQVQSGESIMILERGRPVARLEPVAGHIDATGRLARLERAGVVRIGEAAAPLELLRQPAPELAPGASAAAAVIDQRRTGR